MMLLHPADMYDCVSFVRNGELLLMDAGCEYHGYSSDITRTWPVGGKFTPPQRQLYEVVLRVQKKCIAVSTHEYQLQGEDPELLEKGRGGEVEPTVLKGA